MKEKIEAEEKMLVGKTIERVRFFKIKDCDDIPYILLNFTDGTHAFLFGGYGGYTGKSSDEYRTFVRVVERPYEFDHIELLDVEKYIEQYLKGGEDNED